MAALLAHAQAGVPFDRTIVLHRWLGYILFAAVSCHMFIFWNQV
jgi:hypothetical protein